MNKSHHCTYCHHDSEQNLVIQRKWLAATLLAICCGVFGCESATPVPEINPPAQTTQQLESSDSASSDTEVQMTNNDVTEDVTSPEWIVFEPPNGRCRIDMPFEPRTFAQDVSVGRETMKVHMHLVAPETESAVLMLGYGDYPSLPGLGSKETDEKLMQAIISNTARGLKGKDVVTESTTVEGGHGLTCRMNLRTGNAHLRTMLVDGRLYQLSAATDGKSFTDDDVARFLTSFRILAAAEPPEWTALELQKNWKLIKPGTHVKVRGTVAELMGFEPAIPRTGRSVSVSLVSPGADPTAPFQFADPMDINGLQLGQEIVLQGRAYPRKGLGTISFSRILERGKPLANSPPPYKLLESSAIELEEQSAQALDGIDGVGFDRLSRTIDISDPAVLTNTGQLPEMVAEKLAKSQWIYGIRFADVPVNQNLIEQLSGFESLQHIAFEGSLFDASDKPTLTGINLQPLVKLPSLISFKTNEYAGVNDSHLKSIAQCLCLRTINLRLDTRSDGLPTNEGIGGLAGISSLTSLTVQSGPGMPSLAVTDDAFTPFDRQSSLRELTVKSNNITGTCLKALATIPGLIELSVTGDGLRNESVAALADPACVALKRLFLTSRSLTDDGLLPLAKALPSNVEQLGLERSPLTVSTLKAISERTSQSLTYLNVSKAVLDGDDVLVLSNMKHMTSLTVPDSVAADVKQILKAALPDARIY